MSDLRSRTADAVLSDHLARVAAGDLEGDLARNYSPGAILLTRAGIHRGHDAVREGRSGVVADLGAHPRYEFRSRRRVGPYALLQWRACSDAVHVHDGADTFVIRDGRIVLQAVRYSVCQRFEPTGGQA